MVMSPLRKQEFDDPRLQTTFDIWKDLDEDGQFALDIAVMELILGELAKHQDEVEAKAQELHAKEVKKIYRAATRTALRKHMLGQHDQSDHGNWARQAASFAREALQGVPRPAHLFGSDSGEGEKQGLLNIFSGIAAVSDRVSSATERATEGMRAFLSNEDGWGWRIVEGAKFLAKTGSRLASSAKLIATYGPVTGIRMARAYWRYGGFDVPLPEPGSKEWKDAGLPPPNAPPDQVRNALINLLKKRLPDKDAMDLSHGHAPSQGFLVAPDGTILAQGVGRGKDYFLPFGLRHMRMLKKEGGGEWVRMRHLGGITVEDLHAAMMLGADKVTVVSHSGVFTMDLTERAKGLRSEHFQVLSRFQDLLRTEGRGEFHFDAYDRAMRALELEFPLHFHTGEARKGQFPGESDMAFPELSFLDEIRSMFGLDTGQGKANWRRDMERAGRTPPQHMNQEEAEQWLRRQAQSDPQGAGRALRQYRSLREGDSGVGHTPSDTRGQAGRIPSPGGTAQRTTPQPQFAPRGSTDTSVRSTTADPDRARRERERMEQIQAQTITTGRNVWEADEASEQARRDAFEAMGQDPDMGIDEISESQRILDGLDYGLDDNERWYR